LAAAKYFLTEHKTDGRTWLEHGCIVFSQYFGTADWIATELAKVLPGEPVAVYAGAGRSKLYRDGDCTPVSRENIKKAVRDRDIRLVVATDAASEGLNLQTLGTLINIDLPWNPSRLEQRLGRIKRFGQVRAAVDMLNLVYSETRDEKVYRVLSKRFKDRTLYSKEQTGAQIYLDNWVSLEADISFTFDGSGRIVDFEIGGITANAPSLP
jgi:superfamily II DNA/RNA helicase